MPTISKAQLNHQPYPWDDWLRYQYRLLLPDLVETSGLGRVRRELKPGEPFDHPEQDELLEQLDKVASIAAATRVDAENISGGKLIATLIAIERNPSLVLSNSIEPGALGELGREYQRSDEAPGSFWMDVYDSTLSDIGTELALKTAATRAIFKLRINAKKGRPRDLALGELGAALRMIYEQYGHQAGRVSRTDFRGGKFVQTEDGAFLKFVELVLKPLNHYLSSHPNRPRLFCAVQVARYPHIARQGREKYVRHD